QVEVAMAAVVAGAKQPTVAPTKTIQQKPSATASSASNTAGPSLPALIVSALRAASRPLSAQELAQEAKRRGYQSSSTNFAKQVAKEAYILRKKGILRKRSDERGFSLVRRPHV